MIDVTKKLWSFCNTLRDEGIGYGRYIEQLTYLLFLKMIHEKGIEIPEGCDWDSLLRLKGTDLLNHYEEILKELPKQNGILSDIFAGARNEFRSPVNLRSLIDLIDEIEWTSLDVDVKGEAYEGLLQKYAEEEKGAGQYFTPRPIIRTIVQVMDPKVGETVQDPACGTGGFLIGAYEYLMNKTHEGADLNREERRLLRTKTFSGCEIVLETRRLCLMNCYLHEIETNIYYGDALSEGPHIGKYAIVMTNPPFGVKSGGVTPIRGDFNVRTANKQLNFVQHVMTILKLSGRAAMVVPDNVLFEDTAGKGIRKILLEDFNLHTILRLPVGTFTPYAPGVKANLIFFRKGESTNEVWVYDLRTNMEKINKKNKLTLEHFKEFSEVYKAGDDGNPILKERKESKRFKKFTIKEINERDYNLDITWLRDKSLEDASNLPDPEVLVSDASEKMQAAMNELNDLLVILESNTKEEKN
jgi:type I restriction enzyme M protein